MYYITDYYTDEIIDVVSDFDTALIVCKANADSLIETESSEVLMENILLPF